MRNIMGVVVEVTKATLSWQPWWKRRGRGEAEEGEEEEGETQERHKRQRRNSALTEDV